MMAGMSQIKVLILKGLGSRLCPIDFLPYLAVIKLRGLIVVNNVD